MPKISNLNGIYYLKKKKPGFMANGNKYLKLFIEAMFPSRIKVVEFAMCLSGATAHTEHIFFIGGVNF